MTGEKNNVRPAWQRLTALFASVLMVWGLVPTQAMAEAVALATATDAAQDVAATERPTADAADTFQATTPSASQGESRADEGKAPSAESAADKTAATTATATTVLAATTTTTKAAATDAAKEPKRAARSYVTIEQLSVVNDLDQDLALSSAAQPKVGDTVKAYGTYWDDDEWDDVEISSSDYASISYQWYAGTSAATTDTDSAYASFSTIEGATSRTLKLTEAQAGKYIGLKITYNGGKTMWSWRSSRLTVKGVQVTPADPDSQTLAAAVDALKNDTGTSYSGWYPKLDYTAAGLNVTTMLSDRLSTLSGRKAEWAGFKDIKVSLKGVKTGAAADTKQVGGVDASGNVTFFFLSPAEKTVYTDYSVLQQATPTYTLTLGGKSVEFTPARSSAIGWDIPRVQSYLNEQLGAMSVDATLANGIVTAETASAELPSELRVGGKKVADLEWASSDSSAAKVTRALDYTTYEYKTSVAYTHSNAAKSVTLTCTASFAGASGLPSVSVKKSWGTTVAPKSAEQIAAQKKVLSDALDKIVLKDFTDSETNWNKKRDVDAGNLTVDFVVPRARVIGAPGDARLSYSLVDGTCVKLNGYHGIITRDIEGASNTATIRATLTQDGFSVTRDIAVTVAPISDAEIDEAVSFMERVKADYGRALLGSNASSREVTGDLKPFSEALPNATDPTKIDYSLKTTLTGVVADELPGYDAMAGTNWRTFKSSDPATIADETLHVTRPEADKYVTLTSNLTYKKYESLAQAHPDDARLQKLVNQKVTAAYRVVGTSTHDDPTFKVDCKVVGTDAYGNAQVWATGSFDATDKNTAADVTAEALSSAGLTCKSSVTEYGYYLESITSTDGRTLGYDATTSKFWQLFVNGKASDVAADAVVLQPGDEVTWFFSAWGQTPGDADKANVTATANVIGPDAEGRDSSWVGNTEVNVAAGTTAAQLTKSLLEKNGMTCDDGMWTIKAQAGSTLPNGSAELGMKQVGSDWVYWVFFVNGKPCDEMASTYVVKPGDRITWYYGTYGADLPKNDVECEPGATRPDWVAQWPGFRKGGTGAVTEAATPIDAAKLAWAHKTKVPTDWSKYTSDPIVVNGNVYVAVGDELVMLDAATGATKATARMATSIDSVARMAYADGIIVVPLHGGRLQAFTADTLTCVWATDELSPIGGASQQSLSTPTIADGHVYLGTTSAAGNPETGVGDSGWLCCVSLANGAVLWSRYNQDAGYYWAGAARVGSYLVVSDFSGKLVVHDAASGEVASSVSLGASCRSTVVAGDDGSVYAVSTDGVLHKVSVAADGTLAEAGSVSFAATSTSTPTIVGGKAYIGGSTGSKGGYKGVLDVVDLADMRLISQVTASADGAALPADVKSCPLVSTQGGTTRVYFTCNNTPGGLFAWVEGCDTAHTLFSPEGEQANYCMSNVVSGEDGSLYYVNDSGYLFKLVADDAEKPAEPGKPTTPDKPETPTTPAKPSGAGQATASIKLHSGASIKLVSNVNVADAKDGKAAEKDSGKGAGSEAEVTAGSVGESSVDEAVTAAAEKTLEKTGAKMPWWPFVGMGAGLVLLFLILRRRRENGED